VTLREVSRAMWDEAVRVYLEEAYGAAPVPPVVRARMAGFAGETLEAVARSEAFERVPGDVPPAECERIRLRLGSREYPHMKLGADRIPDSEDWVLAVDCHDRQLMAVAQESERAALEALIRANNDLKTRIERRWTEAGLPTFKQYVRRRLAQQGGAAAAG